MASAMRANAGSPHWDEAVLAAQIFCVDPVGLGGVLVRAGPGPFRDAFVQMIVSFLPEGAPVRRAPLGVGDDRLLGGLDLSASLQAGRPIAEQGILAAADGGVVILPMAERIDAAAAARFSGALDRGRVESERDGLSLSASARIGVIALDEGLGAEERTPEALGDRLAIHLDLTLAPPRGVGVGVAPDAVREGRRRLPALEAADAAVVEGLCVIAGELGLGSARAALFAVRVARAHAALQGRAAISAEDAAVAARLVLAPRASAARAEEASPADAPEAPRDEDVRDSDPDPGRPAQDSPAQTPEDQHNPDPPSLDQVVSAIRAVLPEGIFDRIDFGAARRSAGLRGRGAGAAVRASVRGRPSGSRSGALRAGDRLNLSETLRAAAPWQKLRADRGDGLIRVRREDFRIRRFSQRQEATTIFVVDASGSAAVQRLSEAKGAVELLLAKAYVTRTRVALIAFRQKGAEVLLSPTRSLTRAKRQLAELPGGGGTPLAAGIEAGLALAEAEQAKNHTPLLVVLTDGRANVGLDGSPGRPQAAQDALAAARRVREAGVGGVFIDTSPRPQPDGARFAAAMGATYAPLPYVKGADVDGLLATLTEKRR